METHGQDEPHVPGPEKPYTPLAAGCLAILGGAAAVAVKFHGALRAALIAFRALIGQGPEVHQLQLVIGLAWQNLGSPKGGGVEGDPRCSTTSLIIRLQTSLIS